MTMEVIRYCKSKASMSQPGQVGKVIENLVRVSSFLLLIAILIFFLAKSLFYTKSSD